MLLLLIILDLFVLHTQYRLGVEVEQYKEIGDKMKKKQELDEEEKPLLLYGCISLLYTTIAIPYFLYQLFANLSVPTVAIVVSNVIRNTVKNKYIRIVCDVINIACMFRLGFIIYG